MPALVSAGVLAGLAGWLLGGGVVAAVLAAAVGVSAVRARRRRACSMSAGAGREG